MHPRQRATRWLLHTGVLLVALLCAPLPYGQTSHPGKCINTAGICYTPTNPGDWPDPDPTTVQEALDDLAGAGGGSGDVTDVGPACATGACLTNGVATVGSTLFIFEGTTVDANQIEILSPSADPASLIQLTLPSSTGTFALTSQIHGNGANCAAGSYPLGVDANGAVEGCTAANSTVAAGDVTGALTALDIDELAVEAELESVLDLPDLQGVLTVPKGGTGAAPGADDQVLVSDSGVAATWRSVPNCTDTGGQHLNYTTATNSFSCGTTSSGGGGGNSVEQSITLANAGYYSVAVTGQAWVAAGSEIVCQPFGTTADGLTPEAIVTGALSVSVSDRVAGDGFTIHVYSPNGLTGTVRLHCLGV